MPGKLDSIRDIELELRKLRQDLDKTQALLSQKGSAGVTKEQIIAFIRQYIKGSKPTDQQITERADLDSIVNGNTIVHNLLHIFLNDVEFKRDVRFVDDTSTGKWSLTAAGNTLNLTYLDPTGPTVFGLIFEASPLGATATDIEFRGNIGTLPFPINKLHATDLRMAGGTPTAGEVLTALDTSGNATWSPIVFPPPPTPTSLFVPTVPGEGWSINLTPGPPPVYNLEISYTGSASRLFSAVLAPAATFDASVISFAGKLGGPFSPLDEVHTKDFRMAGGTPNNGEALLALDTDGNATWGNFVPIGILQSYGSTGLTLTTFSTVVPGLSQNIPSAGVWLVIVNLDIAKGAGDTYVIANIYFGGVLQTDNMLWADNGASSNNITLERTWSLTTGGAINVEVRANKGGSGTSSINFTSTKMKFVFLGK